MLHPYDQVFQLLETCLFCDKAIHLHHWEQIFSEMKAQSVAALPGEWLKIHLPEAKSWLNYCSGQQSQWVRVMHVQSQLLELLETHNIPSVIIKGSAAAMYYPQPILRTMGDVDVLVKRRDQNRAAEILEANGYLLAHDKDCTDHHYNYCKNNIHIELHKRLSIIDDEDEKLLELFEKGIDDRVWVSIGDCRFPVLPLIQNGLVLISHINQHIIDGLGLRQIIDWMMYVNKLSSEQWNELLPLLQATEMKRLAFTITVMCCKYLGLRNIYPNLEPIEEKVIDELMLYIIEKGNFGRKAGVEGKVTAIALASKEKGFFFKRLQIGGLEQWKTAKKYPFLRPFAWTYQTFRIFGILIKNHIMLQKFLELRGKSRKQQELLESLGLRVDRTIKIGSMEKLQAMNKER